MTIFNDIYAALENQLMKVDSSITRDNRIQFPNVASYEPDGTEEYIRAVLIPGETTQRCLGTCGEDITEGFYQIEVLTPNGMGRSCNIDLISDVFKRGTDIHYNNVRIQIVSPSIAAGLKERNYYVVPMSIRWRAYTPARK